MSSIIDADPFNDVFTATKDNSTMQGVVTAIYELGMRVYLEKFQKHRLTMEQDVWRVRSSVLSLATGLDAVNLLCLEPLL